jgi:hypothetical protein
MWQKIFKPRNGPKTKPFIGMLKKIFQTAKKLKSAEVLPKVHLSSAKFDKSYQTITFPNGHRAQLFKVLPNADPKSTVLKKLVLRSPEGLIIVSGDTQNLDELIQQRLRQLLNRGLAKTAINLNAVLMDNGKASGLVTLLGQSVANRGHKSPLIGVATAAQVTYPGQTEATEPEAKETTPLESNHSHFVLVDTENRYQTIDFRSRLGAALASHNPAILLLVNGSEESRAEVLQAVRLGWPIITLTGTGQLADEIATLAQNPPDFIPDSDLAEIIADGQIIPFPVEGKIEELERLIHRQLRGDNTLKLAWQQFALYDKNATRQQHWFNRLRFATIIFAVIGTLLALLQASLDLQLQQAKPNVLAYTILKQACQDPNLQKELELLKMQDENMRKIYVDACLNCEPCFESSFQTILYYLNLGTYDLEDYPCYISDTNACNQKKISSELQKCCEEQVQAGKLTLSEHQKCCEKQAEAKKSISCLNASNQVNISPEHKECCEKQAQAGELTSDKNACKQKSIDESNPSQIRPQHLRDAWKIYNEAHLISRFLARHNQEYKLVNLTEYLVAFLQWVIVAIPIIVTILFGLSNRFNHGQKWIWLRSSAEILKSEIFRYRTKAGIYGVDKDRETKLADKVQCFNNHLMQTEVNLSALKPYQGPLPPQYSIADNDDGFTPLSPERYLNLRLEDQLNYYQKKTTELERKWSLLQGWIYGLGGAGTLLAARGFELWIALTTGLVAAITAYLGYQQVEERLQKYNKASIRLTNLLNWWSALSTSEQAKQENIDQLVSDTETALGSEFQEWVQQMQETMMALKEKDKMPEKAQIVELKEPSDPR